MTNYTPKYLKINSFNIRHFVKFCSLKVCKIYSVFHKTDIFEFFIT